MKACLLIASLFLPALTLADQGYGPPKAHCRPTNTSIYAEVCVPGIDTETNPVERNIKNVVDDEYCYTATKTVCQESTRTVENEICTYTYVSKKEEQPATLVKKTYDEKSETMKVTACRATGGYGKSHYDTSEHQVCREEYQTQEYRVPLVNEPYEINVEVAAPQPQQVCETKVTEITETTCEDVEEERCIDLVKLEDDTITVDQTEATLGGPDCNQITLSLPTASCSKPSYGYPH